MSTDASNEFYYAVMKLEKHHQLSQAEAMRAVRAWLTRNCGSPLDWKAVAADLKEHRNAAHS